MAGANTQKKDLSDGELSDDDGGEGLDTSICKTCNLMFPNSKVPWYLAFSFLCTFVHGSEKSIEKTFAPVELSELFAPGERMFQELPFHGTFAPVERCSTNNFRAL